MYGLLFFIFSIPLLGQITLDEAMTPEQKRATGIDRLSDSQKMALQAWVNDNFEPKLVNNGEEEKLTLSMNLDQGATLQLSDGKSYQVDPDDRIYSAYWITPFPVQIGESGNASYPLTITNLTTGTSVKAKEITKSKRGTRKPQSRPIPEEPKAP